jgi:hypothetical protein
VTRAATAVLVLATSVLAVTLAGLTAAPASARTTSPTATPGASQGTRAELSITLDHLEPKVARQRDTLALDGVVTNTSRDSLSNVVVELRASSERISTRYELAHDSQPSTQVGVLIAATRQRLGTLLPGQTAAWQMSVPVQRLGLPSSPALFGAYPLAIEATSSDDSGVTRTRLPTTLLWVPDGAQYTPTQVAWLWPLVDGVHRGYGSTFLDDTLAKDLAPGGRIGRLVQIAADSNLPLSYVVDPALVDDATAMAASVTGPPQGTGPPMSGAPSGTPTAKSTPKSSAAGHGNASSTESPSASAKASGKANGPTTSATPSPYQVAAGHGTAPGLGGATAAAWLAQLRATVMRPGSGLIGLPYGDVDVAALERAGLGKEIAIARSTGQSLLRSELAAPTMPDATWPVGGVLDQPALDDLASDLVTTVVLSDQALPPRDANAVSGPRADLQTASGPVHAVLTDSTIDGLVADPGSVPGGTRAAEQRFLAETMLVTEQRPGSGSSLVLAPPRAADPSNPLLAKVLADTGAVPWLRVVGLQTVAGQRSDDVARQPLTYPAAARQAELPPTELAAIGDVRAGLATFSAILSSTTSDPFIDAANIALLRAESSSWRTKPKQAAQIRNSVAAGLQAQLGQVHINNPRLITMTSRKQKIPLTIVNDLPEPVTVGLRLSAVNAPRLKVTPIPPFTIDGKGGRHDLVVEVEATTSGRFEVQAQLLTPDVAARPVGASVSFELNSTAYGAVALTIAAGAAALLFLLSGIRIFRRIRRQRPEHHDGHEAREPHEPPDGSVSAHPPVDTHPSP